MELVGAALGDQGHLSSRASTLISVIVRRRDPEFLHRINRRGQHRSKSIAAGLVVYVNPVQSDVALIAAGAIDRAVARVLVLINIEPVAGIRHPRLQAEQVRNVAAFQRNLPHLDLIE